MFQENVREFNNKSVACKRIEDKTKSIWQAFILSLILGVGNSFAFLPKI